MDRKSILERLIATRDAVLRHCDAEADEHRKSYGSEKWTVQEILAHIADSEFINLWRFCRSLAEPGNTVEPFDQNAWARELRYAARPVVLSRALFLGARDAIIHQFRTASQAQLDQSHTDHIEKGRLDAGQWADLACAHLEHHLTQIDAARAGTPWKPPTAPDAWLYTSRRSEAEPL